MTQTGNRLVLNSATITLIPLNREEEHLYASCDPRLFTSLGLPARHYKLPSELQHVIYSFILPLFRTQPAMYLYFTSWLIIDPLQEVILGDMSFKGWPNRKGSVEVGYGVFEDYRNKGVMTEALKTICEWAADQPSIREITAETLKTNLASSRVLEKNLFAQYSTRGSFKYWKKLV